MLGLFADLVKKWEMSEKKSLKKKRKKKAVSMVMLWHRDLSIS